ncbi:MAG: Gfo/Idh/MocA family oxidoreductase [Anaerolineae bacterium]|nr:Gfo/Idh/MocA family oxidoreductase [Anaerolineae bacterium]
MDKVRFAIVGCGEIAVQTAKGMAEAPHAEIVMTMDTQLSLAQDLAEAYGAQATDDFEAVLASPQVDAVYIAVPHDLHAPLATAAAQANKHILLEKPIATNVVDAKKIIHNCELDNVTLGIAFIAQVDANCARVRQLIEEGVIGEVAGVRYAALADKPDYYWHGGYTRRVYTDWRTLKARSGGGILIMNLIHDFNTLRYVTGLEVTRAYGEYGTYATPVEVEDLAFATLRYDNGAIGSVEAGSAIRGGAMGAESDRVFGTKGQVLIGQQIQVYSVDGSSDVPAREWTTIDIPQPSARHRIVEGFATALLEGRRPPVTGFDGLKALEIVEAIYRSGETGTPVQLPL